MSGTASDRFRSPSRGVAALIALELRAGFTVPTSLLFLHLAGQLDTCAHYLTLVGRV